MERKKKINYKYYEIKQKYKQAVKKPPPLPPLSFSLFFSCSSFFFVAPGGAVGAVTK